MQKMKAFLANNAAGLALSLPAANVDMDVSDHSLAECEDVMAAVDFVGMRFHLTPNALVPAMPSLSLAMPALPPVVGLDDWSFSPNAMPMLDYDENDINVETVAEENEREFELVAI